MEQLVIKNFLGKNLKASAFDIEHHQCQEISDFEISKIVGSLVRSLGYEIATNILGSNYDDFYKKNGMDGTAIIGNIFEWRTGRASPNNKLYVAWDNVNDKIYYWNNANLGWTELDDSESFAYDKARFFERDNALIISAGIGSTNYPVFIKYYDVRSILGGSDNQLAGYYDHRLNDLSYDTNFSLTLTAYQNLGDLEAGAYFYYACLVYDDVQNGDVSNKIQMKELTTEDSIVIKIGIENTDGDGINRRVTHIKLLRAYASYTSGDPFSDLDTPITQPWVAAHLVATIPLDNNTDALHVNLSGEGTYTQAILGIDGLSSFSVSNDMFIGMYLALWQSGGTKIYKRITDNDTNDFTLADGTGLTDGYTYLWEVVSYWWDNGANYECYVADKIFALPTLITDNINRSSQVVHPYNFKYLLTHDKRTFYAPLYNIDDGKEYKNRIGISNINGNGDYEHDVIRHFINMQDYGVEEITGLGKILDFIIIATYRDLFKINTSSGNIFTWELNETLEDAGCIAPDSWTYIWGQEFKYNGYFYRSSNGYRVYDGYKSQLISMQIEEEGYQPFNITTPTEAVGSYNPKTKQWIISYPTDSIVHRLDLLTGEWLESSYADEFDEFCVTKDGYLLGTDGDKIVVFTNDGASDLTDHDGTSISPSWKSKAYDCEKPGIGKIAKFIILKYKSNTAIQIRWYLNRSSTAKTLNNTDVFAAQSSLKTKTVGLPTSQRFDEIEFRIDLKTANKASNTILQIDELIVLYEVDTLRK